MAGLLAQRLPNWCGVIQGKLTGVCCSLSSSRPELTAIAVACKDVWRDEDLTILTDSLLCMVLLTGKSLQ